MNKSKKGKTHAFPKLFDLRVFCLAAVVLLSLCTQQCCGEGIVHLAVAESCPVAISSLTADLKYNKKQGIKITELQQTSLSELIGYDLLHKKEGLAAQTYCGILSQFLLPVWFIRKDIRTPSFEKEFTKRSWFPLNSLRQLNKNLQFLKDASLPVYDPYDISSYHGILVARPTSIKSIEEFKRQHPGIVIFDLPTFPYWVDKYKMNTLFTRNQELAKVRPVWRAYPKKYSSRLADKIDKEIPGGIVVIKPRKAFKGHGVIIVEKKDLDATLKRILIHPKKLRSNKDSSYSYWAYDPCETFLVEEFIPSDPIQVPDLSNQFFDPTMRAVFVLIYDRQEIRIEFVESHWKLPKMSLSNKGTLNDKHKSFVGDSPRFAKVEPDVNREVEEQLRTSMTLLYREMLSNGTEK